MGSQVSLSRREREILTLLCEGKGSKQIADLLELAIRTVDERIAGMADKAGVASRIELVLWAMQNPAVLQRDGSARPGLHDPDCPCGSPHCQLMRSVP